MASGQQNKQPNQGAREYKAHAQQCPRGQQLSERLQQQTRQNCDGGSGFRTATVAADERYPLKGREQRPFETQPEEEDDLEDSLADSDISEDLIDEASFGPCFGQHLGRSASSSYQQQPQKSCFQQPSQVAAVQDHPVAGEDVLEVYTIPEEADEESAGLSGVALAADLDVLNSDTAQSLLRWRGRPERPDHRTLKADLGICFFIIIIISFVKQRWFLMRPEVRCFVAPLCFCVSLSHAHLTTNGSKAESRSSGQISSAKIFIQANPIVNEVTICVTLHFNWSTEQTA